MSTDERRKRYADAFKATDGWVNDGGQHVIEAMMAVADAELAKCRAAALREAADAIDPGVQECPPECVNDCAGCARLADARMLRGLAARALTEGS